MKLQVITKTKSRENKVVKLTDSVYEVHVKAAPVEGKANRAVIETVADYFHVHQNQVAIISGFTRINKVVEIGGI